MEPFGRSLRKVGCSGVKTAVVTGGASGIGRAVAERLRSDGFQVAVIDLSPTDDGFGQVADVTDRAQVDTAVAAIREELGPILVLVNAAGVEGFKKFSHMSFQEWSKVIDVNLNGVFHTIQAVLPDMVEAGLGTHRQHLVVQHPLRAAVHGPLRGGEVRRERPDQVAGPGIRPEPGSPSTPSRRDSSTHRCCAAPRDGICSAAPVEDHIERTPVRRVGRPEDIAAACAFFISEEAGYITGQILGVNGGRNT